MKGKVKYLPKIVIGEIEDIKAEHKVSDGEALEKMAQYTRIGREVERISRLDFRWKPTKIKPKRRLL